MAKHKSDKLKIITIIEAVIIVLLLLAIIIPQILKITENNSEIERKWLIKKEDIPYDLSKSTVYDIRQTYISFSPEIRVRNIDNGSTYVLTIKTDDPAFKGLKRTEQEYFITESEYSQLIAKKEGSTIHKTRYQLTDNDNIVEIDIFHDQLEGLAYMEIEFPSTSEANAFQTPNWVLKDVTTDLSYKNGHLAQFGIPESFYQYSSSSSE